MATFFQKNKNDKLEKAVRHNDSDLMFKMLQKGADPNGQVGDGHTVMQTAVMNGRLQMLVAFAGKDGKLIGLQGGSERASTLMHLASDIKTVRYLLSNGGIADIGTENYADQTPIESFYFGYNWSYTREEVKKEIFEAIFAEAEKQKDGNPLFKGDTKKRCAVLHAAIKTQVDDTILQKIIDHSKDILNVEHHNLPAIHLAAEWGNTRAIKALMAAGVSVNALCEMKRNAAHVAKDVDTLSFLIKEGINLEQSDRNGYTPVMAAIANSNMERFLCLADRGVNLKRCDSKNMPYVVLAVYNQMDIFREMLIRKADVGVPYPGGKLLSDVIAEAYGTDKAAEAASVMLTVMLQRMNNPDNLASAPQVAAPAPAKPPVQQTAADPDQQYTKLSDVAILVQNGGGFSSMFNFASGQVTEMKDGVPYLTQNFNALGRRDWVHEVREKLIAMNGNPPASPVKMVITGGG